MTNSRDDRRGSRRQFLRSAAVPLSAALLPEYSAAQTAAATQRRVIIDTDPGVDDALAIFLALSSPELRVEAITPVAGNVPLELTLPNALRLVEIAGRTDIPVAAGAREPLVRRLVTAAYAHGENGLGGVQFPEPKTKPVAERAPQLIRQLVRKYPGEITIIAIGPLTNLALAFRGDPEIPPMLRGIVLMGGSLSGGNVSPAAEFNIYVDPEAAEVVFRCGAPITMVGLDVTRRAIFREENVRSLEAASTPMANAAGKIMRASINRMRQGPAGGGGPALHDPLAVATFLDPGVVTLKDYVIDIETAGEFTAGETVGYSRAPMRQSAPLISEPANQAQPAAFQPNAKVAVDVDRDRFVQLLISRLTGQANKKGA